MKRSTAFVLGGGGLLAGLIVANYFAPSLIVLLFGFLFTLALLFLFWKRASAKHVVLFLLFGLAGLFYAVVWNSTVQANVPFGETRTMGAEVIECREGLRINRCLVAINAPFRARGVILADVAVSPGTLVILSGKIAKLLPDQAYLRGDGAVLAINDAVIRRVAVNERSWRTILHRLKVSSEKRLSLALTEPASSLAVGLLFGSRQQFSGDFKDALKKTNTLHIVAVSGFNITILAEFVRRMLGRLPRKVVFVVASFVITAFVAMIGAPASAVRAAIMGVLLLFGGLIGRKPYVPSVIVFTALVMALPNPYLLRFDLGFQLSFLAFIGLMGLAPLMEDKLTFVPRPLRGLLSATLGATLATAPRLIPLNQTISLVGPVTNLLVLPFIPILMVLAALVLFTAFLSFVAAYLVGFLLYLPGLWVVTVIDRSAATPLATVHWGMGVLIIAAMLTVLNILRRKRA